MVAGLGTHSTEDPSVRSQDTSVKRGQVKEPLTHCLAPPTPFMLEHYYIPSSQG